MPSSPATPQHLQELENEEHDPTEGDLPTSPEEKVECSLTLLASVLGSRELQPFIGFLTVP